MASSPQNCGILLGNTFSDTGLEGRPNALDGFHRYSYCQKQETPESLASGSSDDEVPLIERVRMSRRSKLGGKGLDARFKAQSHIFNGPSPTTSFPPITADAPIRQSLHFSPLSHRTHPHSNIATSSLNNLPLQQFSPQHYPACQPFLNVVESTTSSTITPRESTEQYVDDILDAVRRLGVRYEEVETTAKFLPKIDNLGPLSERAIFRKVADCEFEHLLLTMDGAVCEVRDTVKAAFRPFLHLVEETKWIELAVIAMESSNSLRKDFLAVLSDIKHEVDKISQRNSCVVISYQKAYRGKRSNDDCHLYCVFMLEAIFSSIYELKKLLWELELSIKHELWSIKSN